MRLIEKDGSPGSLEKYINIIRVNQVGTFNTLRLAAVAMAKNEPIDGERGACVLTASVAGYEGQIGQIPYWFWHPILHLHKAWHWTRKTQ